MSMGSCVGRYGFTADRNETKPPSHHGHVKELNKRSPPQAMHPQVKVKGKGKLRAFCIESTRTREPNILILSVSIEVLAIRILAFSMRLGCRGWGWWLCKALDWV